jgi:hypothetical protein
MGIISLSCEEESLSNMGRDAGKTFCDCIKKYDKDYCLEDLKDNYTKSQYTSSAFISEFNDTNPCGAELELIYSKSVSNGKETVENFLFIKQ